MNRDLLNERDRLSFKGYQGQRGLENLSAEWTALADSMVGARFVHYPGWYHAYMSSLESDPSRIWFIGAYRGGSLIAVFPVHCQLFGYKGIRARVIGTIEHDEMQSCDFVYKRTSENAKLLWEFTQWLRSQRTIRWDELRLRKVREDSSIAHSARNCLPRGTITLRHDGSGYFQTSNTYEIATQHVSGTFRRNLRRLARRAEESAPLRVQSYLRRDEISHAFDIFLDIEASGWKGDAGSASAIRCRPATLAFFRAIMAQFSERDECVINVLWHGDQPVAGQFCLLIGTTLNILKIGFSDRHSSFAPGNLLLERVIRRACANEGIEIVSLVNEPAWARSFRPLSLSVYSYCTPNWTPRGAMVHIGLLAKRAMGAWQRKPNETSRAQTDIEVTT